ncbi:hypothetical protein ACJQWK_10874 [Exserohilum turcicum]
MGDAREEKKKERERERERESGEGKGKKQSKMSMFRVFSHSQSTIVASSPRPKEIFAKKAATHPPSPDLMHGPTATTVKTTRLCVFLGILIMRHVHVWKLRVPPISSCLTGPSPPRRRGL